MGWTTRAAGSFAAVGLLWLAGCGSEGRGDTPPLASASAATRPEVLVLPPLRRVVDRFPSDHLGQTVEAEIWINDAGMPYPRVIGYEPQAGALLVERLYRPGAGKQDAPIGSFVMLRLPKDGGTWRFLSLLPGGEVEPQGQELCARCHAEAPDGRGVFGRP